MTPPEEIEKELLKLSGAHTLELACASLGLAAPGSRIDIVEATAWNRAGAETYLSPFSLAINGTVSHRLAFKACVAAGPPIEQTLAHWVERRRLLADHGVGTPRLYGVGGGVLLEELLPFACTDQLLGTDQPSRVLTRLAHFYAEVGALGFRPTALLQNLFSRGADVANIDFGEDLGPPSAISTDLFPLFLREVRGILPQLDDRRLRQLYPLAQIPVAALPEVNRLGHH